MWVGGVWRSSRADTLPYAAEQQSEIKPFAFDMKFVDSFRYRAEDALRAVTRAAVKEARVKEIKAEILNSEKLKVAPSVPGLAGPAFLHAFWCVGPFRRPANGSGVPAP